MEERVKPPWQTLPLRLQLGRDSREWGGGALLVQPLRLA